MQSAIALIVAFVLGAAGGYAARAVSAPAAATLVRAAAPCPTSERPVVWYTAHTWQCVAR